MEGEIFRRFLEQRLVRHSLLYLKGSLAEYTLKKLRLLLESNPSLQPILRINLIVTGLPDRVRNRLDRQELESTSDLVLALKGLEHLAAHAYKLPKPFLSTSEPAPKTPEKSSKLVSKGKT
jgi:hypothetical protein